MILSDDAHDSTRRVLFATYHFPPSNQVGARRPARFARHLAGRGYKVDVVCASLGNAVGEADAAQDSLVHDETRVFRVETPFLFGRHPYRPAPRQLIRMAWWRVLTSAEWIGFTGDWSFRWGSRAARLIGPTLLAGQYEAVVLDAPPHPAIVPILRAARRAGVPALVDFRDVWLTAENAGLMHAWHPGWRRQWWNHRLRRETLRLADRVVFTTEEMARLALHSTPALDGDRVHVVPNAFERCDDDEHAMPVLDGDDTLRICYAGSLAYGRDSLVHSLLRGIAVLRRAGRLSVRLDVASHDSDSLAETIRALGLQDWVTLHGWLTRDAAKDLQRRAMAIILLQTGENPGIRAATPAKLFEIMERRRSVLALVPDDGPAARIVREHSLGVVATSHSPEGIADALLELHQRVRLQLVLPSPPEAFSETRTADSFAGVLELVIGGRRRVDANVATPGIPPADPRSEIGPNEPGRSSLSVLYSGMGADHVIDT